MSDDDDYLNFGPGGPPARPRTFKHQLVVRVSDELHEALKRDAEHYGRTVAQSARYAMSRHLGVAPWMSVGDLARERGFPEHGNGPS